MDKARALQILEEPIMEQQKLFGKYLPGYYRQYQYDPDDAENCCELVLINWNIAGQLRDEAVTLWGKNEWMKNLEIVLMEAVYPESANYFEKWLACEVEPQHYATAYLLCLWTR